MHTTLLSWLYVTFVRVLAKCGELFSTTHAEPASSSNASDIALSFAQIDSQATQMGEAYRGIGVAVGLLGAAIVFFALAPDAFAQPTWKMPLSYAKLLLMVVVLVLLFYARTERLKYRWIQARQQAERLRYIALERTIEAANSDASLSPAVVREEALRVLEGDEGQIAYNLRRKNQYENMEHFVGRLTYLGFAVSLTGAVVAIYVGHLGIKLPWLILFTAFVPALVGALHGILGFLRIPQLTAQYNQMSHSLSAYRDRLLELKAEEKPDLTIDLAKQVLSAVNRGDTVWTSIADKSEVHPV